MVSAIASSAGLLDIANVAGYELSARRLVQIQTAIPRSPAAPSYENLHRLISTNIKFGGAVKAVESAQ
eukprot:10491508-Lingulodinium_polyedra.AAC.1